MRAQLPACLGLLGAAALLSGCLVTTDDRRGGGTSATVTSGSLERRPGAMRAQTRPVTDPVQMRDYARNASEVAVHPRCEQVFVPTYLRETGRDGRPAWVVYVFNGSRGRYDIDVSIKYRLAGVVLGGDSVFSDEQRVSLAAGHLARFWVGGGRDDVREVVRVDVHRCLSDGTHEAQFPTQRREAIPDNYGRADARSAPPPVSPARPVAPPVASRAGDARAPSGAAAGSAAAAPGAQRGTTAPEAVAPVAQVRVDPVVVLGIQRELQGRRLYTGPINGEQSPELQRAISEFQRSAGLPVDGRPSVSLLQRLQKR